MSLIGKLFRRNRQPRMISSQSIVSKSRFPQAKKSLNGRLLGQIEIQRALSRQKRK